jgi:hypothetical protein
VYIGTIPWVADTSGGASFTVELPVSTMESLPKTRRPSRANGELTKSASVLLVEDERALALAVSEALTDAGLDVDHAGDGEEALARVRQNTYASSSAISRCRRSMGSPFIGQSPRRALCWRVA